MPPYSILLIRLSAIGDIAMASGVASALRLAYPQARIDWLAQSEAAGLLKRCPSLDRVLSWPRRTWRDYLRRARFARMGGEIRDMVRSLRSADYDLVLDMQGLLKSGVLAAGTGSRRRIGLGSREGSAWLMHEVVPASADERIASEYKDLLRYLRIDAGEYGLGLEPLAEDRQGASALLDEYASSESYAAVCPFTTRAQKHWPEEHWAQLLPLLDREFGLTPVILGGPADKEAAERIRSRAGGRTVNLAGRTDLGQSLALVRGGELVVGVDTGLTHMGVLSHRPTLALFGSTRPYLDPENKLVEVLYSAYSCSPCRRRPTCSDYPCMSAITPEWVLERVRKVKSEKLKVDEEEGSREPGTIV
jgi:heptosyltransferase-1